MKKYNVVYSFPNENGFSHRQTVTVDAASAKDAMDQVRVQEPDRELLFEKVRSDQPETKKKKSLMDYIYIGVMLLIAVQFILVGM